MTCPAEQLKVAIVGCGKIADAHVEEVGWLGPAARVVAVCDSEPLMAEQIAVRYGIPAYYSRLDELLERERPGVVHVATPPAAHAACAIMAMEAGCDVLVEKPLALTAAGACELLAAARELRRRLTVNYSYFFDPAAVRVRELVRCGALGTVVHVESFLGYSLTGPFGSALLADPRHWVHRLPGGLFQNVIDHLLYKPLEFLPESGVSAQAFASRLEERSFGDLRDSVLDELRVVMSAGPVTAYATFSSHARPAAHYLRVFGSRASALADYTASTVVLDPEPRLPGNLGRLQPPFAAAAAHRREALRNLGRFRRGEFSFFAGMRELLRQFYDAVRTGGPDPIPHGLILRVAATMDEIFARVREQHVP